MHLNQGVAAFLLQAVFSWSTALAQDQPPSTGWFIQSSDGPKPPLSSFCSNGNMLESQLGADTDCHNFERPVFCLSTSTFHRPQEGQPVLRCFMDVYTSTDCAGSAERLSGFTNSGSTTDQNGVNSFKVAFCEPA